MKEKQYDDVRHIRSMDTAIYQMINRRRKVDGRLRWQKRAENWPFLMVSTTPEFMIANIVELEKTLKGDGYSEDEIIQKFLSYLSVDLDSCSHNLVSYIQFRLNSVDPKYSSFGLGLLEDVIAISKIGAEISINARNSENGFPPRAWLKDKILNDDILSGAAYEKHSALPQGHSVHEKRDWMRIQMRMQKNDDIWTFAGSILPNGTSFRAGVALHRQGRSIDHVCTVIG